MITRILLTTLLVAGVASAQKKIERPQWLYNGGNEFVAWTVPPCFQGPFVGLPGLTIMAICTIDGLTDLNNWFTTECQAGLTNCPGTIQAYGYGNSVYLYSSSAATVPALGISIQSEDWMYPDGTEVPFGDYLATYDCTGLFGS